MMLRLTAVIIASVLATAPLPAVAQAGDASCEPLMDAIRLEGHEVFARIFEAARVRLNASDPYTVFVPEDGAVVPPRAASGTSGASGIVGLFSAYGIDTATVESIRSSPVFDQIKGFIKYYIVRGAYSVEELQSRSPSNHLTTIFNTTEGTCNNPGETPSTKDSDGDIKIEQVNGQVVLNDDTSGTTVQATILRGDVQACGGSVVHLIKGVLNPCCDSAASDCSTAPLDPKQLNPKATAPAAEVVSAASGAWSSAAGVSLAAGLVAACAAWMY